MRSKLITLLNSLTLIFSSSSCSFQDPGSESVRVRRSGHRRDGHRRFRRRPSALLSCMGFRRARRSACIRRWKKKT